MQSKQSIVFHPADLGRYGTTPSGENLYRIVWSDSRKQTDEFDGKLHFDQPFYPLIQGKWVLEEWFSPEKYIGMTRLEYEAMLEGPMHGKARIPYPEGGEYECIQVFAGHIDEVIIKTSIEFRENVLRNQDVGDPRRRVEAKLEAKEKAVDDLYETELDKAFGDKAYVN